MQNKNKWHGTPPNDEQAQQALSQLKETLGIDYFALNYTTKQPTELERYLGNVKPMLQDCNCQIMAFTEDHKPLPQFCGQSGQ